MGEFGLLFQLYESGIVLMSLMVTASPAVEASS